MLADASARQGRSTALNQKHAQSLVSFKSPYAHFRQRAFFLPSLYYASSSIRPPHCTRNTNASHQADAQPTTFHATCQPYADTLPSNGHPSYPLQGSPLTLPRATSKLAQRSLITAALASYTRSAASTALGTALALATALTPLHATAVPLPPPTLAITAAPAPTQVASLLPSQYQPGTPTPATSAPLAPTGSSATATAITTPPSPPPSLLVPPPALPAELHFTGPELVDALPPIPTQFPPLPELQLPQYTTAQLRNGLRVFLLVDNEVPLVRATMLMRGGQYGSPLDKVGLASLTAYVQRAGGSTAHPAPALDERLEQLAAGIELGAGPQALSSDMSCLAEDVAEVMGLWAEVIRSPRLPADKLELYQAQLYNALEHQNDNPGAVARRKLTKLLYGADSIYARTPTRAAVASITPGDLRAYADKWERPDGAVLGVVGSFQPEEMIALVERLFGEWAPAPGQPGEPPTVPRGAPPALPSAGRKAAAASVVVAMEGDGQGGVFSLGRIFGGGRVGSRLEVGRRPVVYLVDRPGLTQASVLVGEPGISLSDRDVFPLDVLNGVFNSFGGQLFDTLRSREGLAYSVSGSWDSPPDHRGLFLAGGQTSVPGDFLKSLRQLLATAAVQPPSESELASAKSETLNSFAFNFASNSAQLQRILVYDLLGLPQDFLFQYFRGIERVGRDDVAGAAAQHLHPEQQAVVVVADRRLAQPSLEAAGFEVVTLPLDDMEPL